MPTPSTSDETRVVDPVTGGEKGQKTCRMDLIPYDTLMAVASHFGRGAGKYVDRNWERGFDWSLSFAALQRHLALWWQGERSAIDEVFGEFDHLDAAMFHMMVLRTFELRHVGTDDRPILPHVEEVTVESVAAAFQDVNEVRERFMGIPVVRSQMVPPGQAIFMNPDWTWTDVDQNQDSTWVDDAEWYPTVGDRVQSTIENNECPVGARGTMAHRDTYGGGKNWWVDWDDGPATWSSAEWWQNHVEPIPASDQLDEKIRDAADDIIEGWNREVWGMPG